MAKPPKRAKDLFQTSVIYTPTNTASKPFVLPKDEEGFSIPLQEPARSITAWDIRNIRDMMKVGNPYDIPPLEHGQWVLYRDSDTGVVYEGEVQPDGTMSWTPCPDTTT